MRPENDHRNTLTFLRTSTYPELYQKTVEWQDELQRNGIAAHNHFADECTNDFACCTGEGDYHTYFPSYEVAIIDWEVIKKTWLADSMLKTEHKLPVFYWFKDQIEKQL